MNDIEMFEKWILSTKDIDKAIRINNVHIKMLDKKIEWIEKGIVGRFIYKYLGI